MSRITLFLLLFLLPFLLSSQTETYSRVKIHLDGKPISLLHRAVAEIQQANLKEGWVVSEVSAYELHQLAASGFRYDIILPDMSAYYRERNTGAGISQKSAEQITSSWPVPLNFTLGSCGGFLTVDDMLAQLDLMRSLYPNLVSIRQPVSDTVTTIEGRPVYYVRISDNPDLGENEPQVLYTGMIHAREPIGMQHLLYYMWYLLENYDSNPEVRDVVDNTEMYFIPVVNVDGYLYNISTFPSGGGMWRKNRRNSGGGNFGVDINRNFGYMWGYDDEGSSPDPAALNYRGTAAFSEPETRMLKYFCESHDFKIALNYHSYSNLFLYPWGWTDVPCADDALFNAYGSVLTTENGYTFGPGSTTIYPTNGGSDDWMYGEQTTKPLILSYTPEVGNGNDGFWPSQNRIIPLCQENMYASYTAARLVGKYGRIMDASPLFIYQDNGYLAFDVKRLGLQEGDFTASILPLDNAFTSIGSAVTFQGLGLLEKRTDSISYQLAPVHHVGDTIRYILVLDNGFYQVSDTVERIFGYPFTVFSDPLNSKSNWTGNWTLINTSYFSPPSCITDSPLGNYGTNSNRSISLVNSIPLGDALLTVLEFRAKWAIEADYDFVQVKISNNNGTSWTALNGKYTTPGTSNQLFGQPLYEGVQSDWIREAISLNNWQDQNIKLRFTLDTDAGTEMDGYYFDDVSISILMDPTSLGEQGMSRAMMGLPVPNPANDRVSLNYRLPLRSGISRLSICNAAGQVCMLQNLSPEGESVEFSVKNLPPGLYFIRLEVQGMPVEVRKLSVF